MDYVRKLCAASVANGSGREAAAPNVVCDSTARAVKASVPTFGRNNVREVIRREDGAFLRAFRDVLTLARCGRYFRGVFLRMQADVRLLLGRIGSVQVFVLFDGAKGGDRNLCTVIHAVVVL